MNPFHLQQLRKKVQLLRDEADRYERSAEYRESTLRRGVSSMVVTWDIVSAIYFDRRKARELREEADRVERRGF